MNTIQYPRAQVSILEGLLEVKRVMHMRPSRRPQWFDSGVGICNNLLNLMDPELHHTHKAERVLRDIFCSWEHYSGRLAFPIPSQQDVRGVAAPTAYRRGAASIAYFNHEHNQYDRRSPYCKLRYQLIDYLIAQMSK